MIHYNPFSFVILKDFFVSLHYQFKQAYHGKNDQNIRAHGARPSVLSQALPRGSLAQTPSVDHSQSGAQPFA